MRRIFVAGISLLALVVCMIALNLYSPTAKAQEKRVIKETAPIRFAAYRDAPIRITKIALGDQELSFGKDFAASDGFLKSIRMEVINESSEAVTYFSLNLKMQTGIDEKSLLVPCEFGDAAWKQGPPSVEPPALIKPGQAIWVNLLDGRKSGLDPMASHKAQFAPKSYQFELGVDIVMLASDSMWRMGYLNTRVAPTQFVPIIEGVPLQELKDRLQRAINQRVSLKREPTGAQPAAFKLGKSFAPTVRPKTGRLASAEPPCDYDLAGFNYVSCNDMYGQICAYEARNTTPRGWYIFAGSYLSYCVNIYGGGTCYPGEYYPPLYIYCGI